MKKNTFILLALIMIGSTLSSCKKLLTEDPKNFVSPDSFFANKSQCIAALNGVYIPLNSLYNASLFTPVEAVTDLAYLNNSAEDSKLEVSPSNPGYGEGIWRQCYKGVMYCNSAIAGITGTPISDEEKAPLLAEGITLRALYYYILTSFFGDVPFYTANVGDLKTLEEIMKIGRMPATETRKQLVDELLQHAPKLPAKKTSEVVGNRPSSAMAYMLAAKMAMWNKDYATALTALKEIQKVYGALGQYKLEDTYYRLKNTPESIFEIQYTWSATGLKKTSTIAALTTPPKRSGTDIYDGVSIPELGTTANPFTSITPSAHFLSLYQFDDPRRDIILGYEYNGKSFTRPASNNFTGKPWMGPKFWCPGMDNIADGNNQRVFRYADVLLMIAECANEMDDPTTAMAALNEVKARASATYVWAQYPGKTGFFEEVKNERARELMGEYTRKWDLVRWGIYYEAVKSTIANEYLDIGTNLRPYHEYYPISAGEVARSGGILTNDAYAGQ